MPICPIDTGRYGSREMKGIFEEENRIRRMLEVEAAVAKVQAMHGLIPVKAAEEIARSVRERRVKVERVKEIESAIRHETMAVVRALAETCGDHGGYVHLGLTSSDVLDTALALQIKDAIGILERRLRELITVLLDLAERYADLTAIGRTHGQHALPITLGFKFALFAAEFHRHLQRLKQLRPRILVGKISGAVGTFASIGEKGPSIQREVLASLGLHEPLITTQIVQRDRHAELVFLLALTASSLDKLATEIRNLQRTEIGEVAEPFTATQVGSSTMPHKRNPFRCERVTSLARLMRSMVIPALENVITWHERDLANSANERFIIPESFILIDEMLCTMIKVLRGLEINQERVRGNLEMTRGLIMAEKVMMELVKRGMGRQDAHELLKRLSLLAISEGKHLKEVLSTDKSISSLIPPSLLAKMLDPASYVGLAPQITRLTVQEIRKSLKPSC